MGNIGKTIRFLKRNGIVPTIYAVTERLLPPKGVPFDAEKTEEKTLSDSLMNSTERPFFSVLVPVYETNSQFLEDMIESVLVQTYPNFELILADASQTDNPKQVILSYEDERINYLRLLENKGISENTNEALEAAKGDYCALLDHDDILDPDALLWMAQEICYGKSRGTDVKMLYTDEDKCDTNATKVYDPHFKQKLNLDLLLSNNYVCHFTAIKTSLLKVLKFREEYNGSQDHDLFLRAVGRILFPNGRYDGTKSEEIVYISEVLYHWRCHEDSTAFNPASKEYAYVSGRKAIGDFVKTYYGDVEVKDLLHKGFYRVEWPEDIFQIRPELAAIGGFITDGRKITHGIINADGSETFAGMNIHFSGYRHRAHVAQDVFGLDLRNLVPCESMKELYDSLMEGISDENALERSISFAKEAQKRHLLIMFDPVYNKSAKKLRKTH